MEIRPTPTAEEAAAIAAVVTIVEQQRRGVAAPAADDTLHLWVEASRRSAQRAGLQRGPWRLSGRLGRRARA